MGLLSRALPLLLITLLAACQLFDDPPYSASGLQNGEEWCINGGPFYTEMMQHDDTIRITFRNYVDVENSIPDYELELSGIPLSMSGDTVYLSPATTADYGKIASASQTHYNGEFGAIMASYGLTENDRHWLWFRQEANGDLTGAFEIGLTKNPSENALPATFTYEQVAFSALGVE